MSIRSRPLPISLALLLVLAAVLASASPARAQPPRWTQVSVGDDHACALDAEGRVFCWGNNHAGQLGARTPIRCGIVSESGARSCYPLPSDTTPVEAGGGMRFDSVSAGRYRTCALDHAGKAFCWGTRMGDTAAYTDRCLRGARCSFAPVPLEPRRVFVALNAQARCGVDAAGVALCWGNGVHTPAGSEKVWPRTAFASLDGESGTGGVFCAAARDGRVFCRGENDFGELGVGRADSVPSDPGPVESAVRFTRVAVLDHWVCALDGDGAAHCWGAGGYADAPRGSAPPPGFGVCNPYGSPTLCATRPWPVAGGLRFRSLEGTRGRERRMLALVEGGAAYTWRGDHVPRPWRPEHRWASVSGGDWGECGVTTDGQLFCWGRDPHEEVRGRIRHPDERVNRRACCAALPRRGGGSRLAVEVAMMRD